jgi:hypothetical protein
LTSVQEQSSIEELTSLSCKHGSNPPLGFLFHFHSYGDLETSEY